MFNLFAFRQGNNKYAIELDARESINSLISALEQLVSRGIYQDISMIDFSVSSEDYAIDFVLYSCLVKLYTDEKLFNNYSTLNTDSKQYLYLKDTLKDIKKTVVETKSEIDVYDDEYLQDDDSTLDLPELAFPEKYDNYFNFTKEILNNLTLNNSENIFLTDTDKLLSNFEYVNSRIRIDLLHANYFNSEEFTTYSEKLLNNLDIVSNKLNNIIFTNFKSYLQVYIISFELVLLLNTNSLNFFKKENAEIFINKLDNLINLL